MYHSSHQPKSLSAKKAAIVCPLILLVGLLFSACGNHNIRQVVKEMAEAPTDTTTLVAQTVRTNAFSTVEVDCFADVFYHQTATEAPYVRLQTPKEVQAHVSVRTVEDALFIATDRRYRMPEDAIIVIHIYAPFVSKFVLNGGKCLRLARFHVASPLTVEINGVGALTADSISAPELALTLDGDSSADISGLRVERLTINKQGDGIAILRGEAAECHIFDAGASPVDVSQLRTVDSRNL